MTAAVFDNLSIALFHRLVLSLSHQKHLENERGKNAIKTARASFFKKQTKNQTGIRMLDQPYMTDLIEANSMGHEPHLIDIYSASWGPTDDGKTVDGPRNATMRAIVRGVNEGRRGLGNIYVWASGDGGSDDDCNCDGYAASMWTISINSAINDGQNAHYDESCSSTLASTFSNGAKDPNTGVVSPQ
jgi:proprotein convertase subtilisin/kexin type 2